jgi:hypothetical protein
MSSEQKKTYNMFLKNENTEVTVIVNDAFKASCCLK